MLLLLLLTLRGHASQCTSPAPDGAQCEAAGLGRLFPQMNECRDGVFVQGDGVLVQGDGVLVQGDGVLVQGMYVDWSWNGLQTHREAAVLHASSLTRPAHSNEEMPE